MRYFWDGDVWSSMKARETVLVERLSPYYITSLGGIPKPSAITGVWKMRNDIEAHYVGSLSYAVLLNIHGELARSVGLEPWEGHE